MILVSSKEFIKIATSISRQWTIFHRDSPASNNDARNKMRKIHSRTYLVIMFQRAQTSRTYNVTVTRSPLSTNHPNSHGTSAALTFHYIPFPISRGLLGSLWRMTSIVLRTSAIRPNLLDRSLRAINSYISLNGDSSHIQKFSIVLTSLILFSDSCKEHPARQGNRKPLISKILM